MTKLTIAAAAVAMVALAGCSVQEPTSIPLQPVAPAASAGKAKSGVRLLPQPAPPGARTATAVGFQAGSTICPGGHIGPFRGNLYCNYH